MQSILIVGKNINKLKKEAQDLCEKNKISKFDIEILETEKAVGIGEIRSLQKNIFLKPLKSEKKAVILEAFYGATIEAQNAFLKILEEPPANTIIIMLSTSLDFVLPTVLSRCVLINLEKTENFKEEEIAENLKILSSVTNNSSAALIIAQKYSKDRETALRFLEKMIISVHTNLETARDAKIILKNLQKTYAVINTTNVNVRLALENLFLKLK